MVDEDGLPNGVGNTDLPNDDDEDYTPLERGDRTMPSTSAPFRSPSAAPAPDRKLTEPAVLETSLKTLADQKVLRRRSELKLLIGYVEGTYPTTRRTRSSR